MMEQQDEVKGLLQVNSTKSTGSVRIESGGEGVLHNRHLSTWVLPTFNMCSKCHDEGWLVFYITGTCQQECYRRSTCAALAMMKINVYVLYLLLGFVFCIFLYYVLVLVFNDLAFTCLTNNVSGAA